MGNATPTGLEVVFKSNSIENYGLVCIGLQESTYKSDQPDCVAEQLNEIIDKALGPKFVQVEYCRRAQLQMFIFAEKSVRGSITNIEKQVENTGFLHVFPNKGGLLCTFTMSGTKLAFLSCHLTAHEGVKHCKQRNDSIIEILGGARTMDSRFDVSEQSHHMFWMGDMNYRTTYSTVVPKSKSTKSISPSSTPSPKEEIPTSVDDVDLQDDDDSDDDKSDCVDDRSEQMLSTYKMIQEEDWNTILDHDELNREIREERVLNGFTALQPQFPPTFKRVRNVGIPLSNSLAAGNGRKWNLNSTDEVQTFYDKKRIPSFTDRVLFKSMSIYAANLSNDFFNSCEDVDSSDHKPVIAGFTIQLNQPAEDNIKVYNGLIQKDKGNKKMSPSDITSSSLMKKKYTLELVLSDLKGFNLAEMDSQMFGGGSDPFIVVTLDPPSLLLNDEKKYKKSLIKDGVVSSVIKHNLNPSWGEETMTINIASIDIDNLSKYCNLVISLWDEDKVSANDLIGMFNLPFKDIIDYYDSNKGTTQGMVFNKQLRNNSELAGTFSGCISLNGNLEAIRQQFHDMDKKVNLQDEVNAYENFSSQNGCNCVVN